VLLWSIPFELRGREAAAADAAALNARCKFGRDPAVVRLEAETGFTVEGGALACSSKSWSKGTDASCPIIS
jgi:hypothetical protein